MFTHEQIDTSAKDWTQSWNKECLPGRDQLQEGESSCFQQWMAKEKLVLFGLILECATVLNVLHASSPEPSSRLWRMLMNPLYR